MSLPPFGVTNREHNIMIVKIEVILIPEIEKDLNLWADLNFILFEVSDDGP